MTENQQRIFNRAKGYYRDIAFYLSDSCEETYSEIADTLDMDSRKILGDMVEACIIKGYVKAEKKGKRTARTWIGPESLTDEQIKELEKIRVKVSYHDTKRPTWAALIAAGTAPTLDELTGIMALCPANIVVAAFRARKNL